MQQYIKILGEFEIQFIAIVNSDTDKSIRTHDVNKHIKRDTVKAKSSYFEVEPDFEGVFDIKVGNFMMSS